MRLICIMNPESLYNSKLPYCKQSGKCVSSITGRSPTQTSTALITSVATHVLIPNQMCASMEGDKHRFMGPPPGTDISQDFYGAV